MCTVFLASKFKSKSVQEIQWDIFVWFSNSVSAFVLANKKDIFIHVVLPILYVYVCLCRYVYNQWCQQTIGAWTVLWYDGHHYLCCNKCCLTIKLLHFSVYYNKTNRSSNFRWETSLQSFLRVAISWESRFSLLES